MSRSKAAARNVAFTCRAPEATAVYLAGAFNDWSADAIAMRKDAKGVWSASVKLEPGRYEYKFVVDGEWCTTSAGETEPERLDCVPNPFGTQNRVIEVS